MKIMPLLIIKLILQLLWEIYWKFGLNLNWWYVGTGKRIGLRTVSVSRNQIRPWHASLPLLRLSHHPEKCCRISLAGFSRSSAKFQLIIQNNQTTKQPINYLSDSKKNNIFRKADSCSTYKKIPPILWNTKLHFPPYLFSPFTVHIINGSLINQCH